MLESIGEIIGKSMFTSGSFGTEPESASRFDQVAENTGLFYIHKEVRGWYLQPRLGAEPKRPRIDRVLVPRPELLELGWSIGAVGVEIKKSDEKVGKPICQLADYVRAAWTLPDGLSAGSNVVLSWCFLWPWETCKGPLASFCANNCIGHAFSGFGDEFILASDSTHFLRYRNGQAVVKSPVSGKKAGSR